jgi:hypothetical protein
MLGQKRKYKKTSNKFEHSLDGTTTIFLKRRTGQTFECLIDTEDLELVRPYRWRVGLCKHTAYAVTTTDEGKRLNLSTLVCPGCEVVLYRNYNGLDNRKSNLYPGTQSKKSTHKRKHKNLTSRFKGVHKLKGTFRATIKADGDGYDILGRFNSEVEAAACYNEEASKRFGEFACLNELPEEEWTCS